MTDYKKLCAELVEELEGWVAYGDEIDIANAHVLIDRARSALADEPAWRRTWETTQTVALAEQESGIPKNCWLDDEPYLCPSPCVFDDPSEYVSNCMFAKKLEADSKPKTDCKYYRQ